MLSGMFPVEAIELLVAKVFTDPAPLETPGSVLAGFLRFLQLLSSHDFGKQPLIVDPQGHLSAEDYESIHKHFEAVRGDDHRKGPPMYLISPYDRKDSKRLNEGNLRDFFVPTFTQLNPEQVILARAVALAKRSYSHLLFCMTAEIESGFGAVFQESSQSLRSFSVLLRVDPEIVVDSGCSSTNGDFALSCSQSGLTETPFTRSCWSRFNGPKALRKKIYKNLTAATGDGILHEWQPVNHLVDTLRLKFGDKAVFFYNELTPEIIAVLWRPDAFKAQPLSALHSEYRRPIQDSWQNDSLVLTNADDIMEEMKHVSQVIVMEVKVLDDRSIKTQNAGSGRKRKLSEGENSNDSSDEENEN